MKTVKKSLDIPLNITIVDENGNTLGSGSGTISFEYEYEVPELIDFITKGSLPAIGADIILRVVARR